MDSQAGQNEPDSLVLPNVIIMAKMRTRSDLAFGFNGLISLGCIAALLSLIVLVSACCTKVFLREQIRAMSYFVRDSQLLDQNRTNEALAQCVTTKFEPLIQNGVHSHEAFINDVSAFVDLVPLRQFMILTSGTLTVVSLASVIGLVTLRRWLRSYLASLAAMPGHENEL